MVKFTKLHFESEAFWENIHKRYSWSTSSLMSLGEYRKSQWGLNTTKIKDRPAQGKKSFLVPRSQFSPGHFLAQCLLLAQQSISPHKAKIAVDWCQVS